MISVQPQYITDHSGKKISVVLSIQDYEALLEELELLEDVKLYDEAKKEDTGDRILFSEYLKERKQKNA
jgi:PHD/YefM family antitoxin component YafN of YafNO toxin-antitoxin module